MGEHQENELKINKQVDACGWDCHHPGEICEVFLKREYKALEKELAKSERLGQEAGDMAAREGK